MFEKIEMAPADPILGLNDAFKNDKSPAKINLGVGIYKNSSGETPILKAVKKAEKILLDNEKTKNYLSIEGTSEYTTAVKKLIFGDNNSVITSGRAVTVQSPGGTGALKIAADFIKKFMPDAEIWISNPSWENHKALFNEVGFTVNNYPYYNYETNRLDFDNLIQQLLSIPSKDVVVLHACCHNPTGIDINQEQWQKVIEVARERKFLILFDFAYQGFGKGLEEDPYPIRVAAEKLDNFLVANSFSKNFGLYNERVGGLSAVLENSSIAEKVLSQLKICIRRNYSNPPSHGAAIVTTILNSSELTQEWEAELAEMRESINSNRAKLLEAFKNVRTKKDFSYMSEQQGMFSFTGLSPENVKNLRYIYSIYMTGTGRINLAGLNPKNLDRFAAAVKSVVAS